MADPGGIVETVADEGYVNGNRVIWVYADTLTPVSKEERPCPKCGKLRDGCFDACWGYLPGVTFACCGHGVQEPYVELESGVVLRGKDAEEWVQTVKQGMAQ